MAPLVRHTDQDLLRFSWFGDGERGKYCCFTALYCFVVAAKDFIHNFFGLLRFHLEKVKKKLWYKILVAKYNLIWRLRLMYCYYHYYYIFIFIIIIKCSVIQALGMSFTEETFDFKDDFFNSFWWVIARHWRSWTSSRKSVTTQDCCLLWHAASWGWTTMQGMSIHWFIHSSNHPFTHFSI